MYAVRRERIVKSQNSLRASLNYRPGPLRNHDGGAAWTRPTIAFVSPTVLRGLWAGVPIYSPANTGTICLSIATCWRPLRLPPRGAAERWNPAAERRRQQKQPKKKRRAEHYGSQNRRAGGSRKSPKKTTPGTFFFGRGVNKKKNSPAKKKHGTQSRCRSLELNSP